MNHLRLASTRRGSGGAIFDPATLPLSLWVRASFSGSPWAGVASAGGSGGRDLTEATNPPAVGATVNALAPADFDGSNDRLGNATAIGTLLSASAWSFAALVMFDANANAGNAGILELASDTGGYWCAGTWVNSGDKFVVGQWDGAQKSVETPVTLGAWQLVQAKYDGTNLKARVNSGAWASAASGNIQVTTGTFNLGANYLGSLFLNGKVLETLAAASTLADASFDNILSYARTRYALPLT